MRLFKGLLVFITIGLMMLWISKAAAKSVIDNRPEIVKPIEGPRTFKIFAVSKTEKGDAAQRTHVLTLLVDGKYDPRNKNRKGYGKLVPLSSTTTKELKDLSIEEGEALWGKADRRSDDGRYYFYDSLTTEDHKLCRLAIRIDKKNCIRFWQAFIDGGVAMAKLE